MEFKERKSSKSFLPSQKLETKLEGKEGEPLPVRLHLDFDGTLTGAPGSNTVFTELYQSLQTDPNAYYDECTFIDTKLTDEERINKMAEILKKGFQSPENQLMKMTPEAFNFVKNMLESPNVEINIISKNRIEYIKAMLKVMGLEDDQMSRLRIKDVNNGGGEKGIAVREIDGVLRKDTRKYVAVVCDDDKRGDFHAMRDTLKEFPNVAKIIERNDNPGRFDWRAVEDEIRIHAKMTPRPSADIVKEAQQFKDPKTREGLNFQVFKHRLGLEEGAKVINIAESRIQVERNGKKTWENIYNLYEQQQHQRVGQKLR